MKSKTERDKMTTLEYIDTLIKGKDYPEWMGQEALITLVDAEEGYLGVGETPKEAIRRIARNASHILNEPALEQDFFTIIWNGWLGLASPVWANFGTNKGLPISCFNTHCPDSLEGIGLTLFENIMMTGAGGGTSLYMGDVRGRGAKIGKGKGKSNGTKSFMQMFDTMIRVVSQGGMRRGRLASYLPIDHPDIEEFLNIREVGDEIQELMTGVCISDEFVDRLYDGDKKALDIWAKVLETKNNTGVPYLLFTGNANKGKSVPEWYGEGTDYLIKGSNLCSEIMLPSTDDESFVCCLSSLNMARYEEWKNTNLVELSVYFLDAVMSEFITKTKGKKGMERAHKFASRHRALGLGVLGWHSFLQSQSLAFTGLMAGIQAKNIFKKIYKQAEEASIKMAEEYGACEVCAEAGVMRRHTALRADAPTTTNAGILGVSTGIEPWASNYYIKEGAKGTFIYKNPFLEGLLKSMDKDTKEVWDSIGDKGGSVQHLDFLSDFDKELFLTMDEINQFELIEQAGIRQDWVDQGVSLNINIPPETPAKVRAQLYLTAHRYGVKSIYYQRSESIAKQGLDTMNPEGCSSCEG